VSERRRGRAEPTDEWAVGLAQAPCYRMAFYDNPVVLVVDFKRA